jgi:hypothetical protein
MMKLKATNPLVLFVGALAIGLAGCADDVIITEPPPPPPPPPPESAEISIVSFVDPDSGAELGQSDLSSISGEFGVVINFDTGGFEAAALDLLVDSDVVACQTFSGQGSVGVAGDVQTVQCIIDSAEGVGACAGTTLTGRFENGSHTIAAELTLGDGSTVRATSANSVFFSNDDEIRIVSNDIGPRVVGLDERGWWGGPRDLSWYVCPVIFTDALEGDVCEITVVSSNDHDNGDPLAIDGDHDSPKTSIVLDEEPFEVVAQYRDLPALLEGVANPDWADSESLNEDRVESEQDDGEEDLDPTKVLACDGTDITSSFDLNGTSRPIDSSAPLCDDDPCQVWIDDDWPITDDDTDADFELANALYSDGDFDLRGDDGVAFEDGGVGFVQGQTVLLNAWDIDSFDGDLLDLTLYLENVAGVDDLAEDDACGFDETTDQALGGDYPDAWGQCTDGAGDDGGVDAYVIQIARVGDLLGNELGDGTEDTQLEDEFVTELTDNGTGLGVVVSGQLGADFTGPEIDPDELMPPADGGAVLELFVWNPDLDFDGVDDDTRGCGPLGDPLDQDLCENLMFEALDPDLASGDAGAGVDDAECGPATNPASTECIDGDGDGELITVEIDDSPGDDFNDQLMLVTRAWDGVASTDPEDGMFAGYICDEEGVVGTACDGTNDGTYTVTHTVPDKAQHDNNVSEASYSFIIDTNQPVIGFGGITGLNSSNAATVEFVLDASVVDRNGDGTAVTSAVVQVTGISGGGDCSLGVFDLVAEDEVLVTPEGGNDAADDTTVEADVTDAVQTNGGDFSKLFTAENLGAGPVTYCFTIIADDGAARKNGDDDELEINAVAGKDFTWQ